MAETDAAALPAPEAETSAPALPAAAEPVDKDAAIRELQATVAALKAELEANKEEKFRLQRVLERKSSPRRASAPAAGGSSVAQEAAAASSSKRKVGRPSSRLYNPRKLKEKNEKLRLQKERDELAKCSFAPKTKTKVNKSKATRGNKASNRLFEQAKRYQDRRRSLMNEKGKDEMKDCTFSPTLLRPRDKIDPATQEETFSRLSEPRRVKESETGLDDKELLECTFTPKLINPQRSAKGSQGATHDRLYAEAILRKSKQEQIRQAKEKKELMEELDGCTFAPEVNVKTEYLNTNQGSVVERLYNQDVEARNAKMENLRKSVEKEHPFKPKIRKNKQYQTASGDIIERLYQPSRLQKDDEGHLDPECTFSPEITSLASKIDRGDLPTHERLALEMSPSQKIALADMEDYYEEDDEYYGDYYEGEEDEYYDEEEEGDMEEIDEDDDDDDDDEIDLP